MRFIFDLDGTVIDSSHRKSTLPDGTLDLAHWVENSTPEKVAADSLLPCAETMRAAWNRGRQVYICTARVMAKADFLFLKTHGLNYHVILSRPEGCTMADAELKEIQLRLRAQTMGISWANFRRKAIMFDDAQSVLQRMNEIGIDCLDATEWNAALAARLARRAAA